MPPLKWARLNVRDTGGQGGSQDIMAVTDGGPGIMNVHNGVFGPDGMPYPLKVALRSASPGSYGDIGGGSLGPGGFVYSVLSNDSNGNSARLKYALTPSKFYAVFRGNQGLAPLVSGPAPITAAQGSAGLNVGPFSSFDALYGSNDVTLFNQPIVAPSVAGVGGAPTPPCIVACGGMSTDNTVHAQVAVGGLFGYPVNDASVVVVTAKSPVQPVSGTMANGNVGFFVLYRNATNWYLAKTTADTTNVNLDPAPDAGFNTTNVERYQMWGQYDTVTGVNATQPPHASGTEGAYVGSQAVDYFQGRVVMGGMIFCPKYVVAADRDTFVMKQNRVTWTILPNEKPSRGLFTTNSYGLTHLQWPWSIEPNNFVDVDNVGNIYQLINMGDNQLVVLGDRGLARLTGYLSTAVSGVNSSTFDVRPIMGSPGLRWPGAAVLTRRGIYYVGKNSIYLYNGSGIEDVLHGSIKTYFNTSTLYTDTTPGGLNNNFYFAGNAQAGIIDDNYIYFSAVGTDENVSPTIHFLLNIETGKWSTFGPVASPSDQNGLVVRSVMKNTLYSHRLIAPASSSTGGLIKIPTMSLQYPKQQMVLAHSGLPGAVTSGWEDTWTPSASGTSPDKYVIALRMTGSVGIPKRFVHAVINYGFTATNGTPVCRVKYLYGASFGDAPSTVPATLGTLPFMGTASTALGGNLPNQSVRLSFNETSWNNPGQSSPQTFGWADAVLLIIELDFSAGLGHFILNSVDVSYIERPGMGHTVMTAA